MISVFNLTLSATDIYKLRTYRKSFSIDLHNINVTKCMLQEAGSFAGCLEEMRLEFRRNNRISTGKEVGKRIQDE